MIDLIRQARRDAPGAEAVVTSNGTLTYEDLEARVDATARGIQARGMERAACVVADQSRLLEVLAGSNAVGCEACSYAPLLPNSGVDELAAAFDHRVVITDRDLKLTTAQVVDVDELPLETGTLNTPGSMPVMVLTTGTTARPKAALYDWSRLIEPTRTRHADAGDRWLLAYNLNQFAGLQVALHVLAGAATLVVPESNQPRDALRAIVESGVTHISATPTFWRFLIALLDSGAAPVPNLQQATLGGEASSDQVLSDVHRLFPNARVSHVYASTEFGSGVSVGDGRQGLPMSVLERPDGADVQFRIVDGQLEARSAVGMLGYYGSDAPGAGEWRPTGDLVEIRDDRIYFVGRASETINVGGVKVHPLAIEDLVAAVPGVELVHAYGRSNPVSGQIVAVDVVAATGSDRDVLERAIHSACEVLAPAARPRRVRFVDQIEVREQKIVRSAGSSV